MGIVKTRILILLLFFGAIFTGSLVLFLVAKGFLFAENRNDLVKVEKKVPTIQDYDISEFFYYVQEGKTSWYGKKFHKRGTASGETYDMYRLTGAHRSLPFGTIVRVRNLINNRTVLIRITDRGPFVYSKILDLSYKSARELEAMGNPPVKIETLVSDPEVLSTLDDEYYFGYSFDYPLVCLPKSKLKIFGEFTDFDQAVEEYKKILEMNQNYFVYLLVPANQVYRNIREVEETPRFLIGYFVPSDTIKNNYLVEKESLK